MKQDPHRLGSPTSHSAVGLSEGARPSSWNPCSWYEREVVTAGDWPARYHRHDLVRVDPAAWAALLATRLDLDGVPHIADWAEAGRPLIVRRFVPGEARDRVPLGLPLPPADGKRRIGFSAPASDLMPYTAPTLDEAHDAAPLAWSSTLDALHDLGRDLDIVPRPFGSLLWEKVTGLSYLSGTSDLDLLWPLPDAKSALALLDGLGVVVATAPMHLDGEFLFPDGAGVQWRELSQAPDGGDVLVKHLDRLQLCSVSALRARLAVQVKP